MANQNPDKLSSPTRKRFYAKAVDAVIVLVFIQVIYPIGPLLGFAYALLADAFFEGQSAGKKLFDLKVISVTRNAKCNFLDSILRNAPFGVLLLFLSIPILGWFLLLTVGVIILVFEIYMLLKDSENKRIGDILAHTKVIASK